ncbi:FAD-linked oxidase-like protein [Lactarius pseudohatsudake]|nr:FAD-linked oxidase-like protein [Lactarius pseudohatsudake]
MSSQASSYTYFSTSPAFVSNVQLDPGPTATIGGMLSSGYCGSNAVRYGTGEVRMVPERGQPPFCQWDVRALNLRQTVVLPSGEVIKTRRRSRKSSARFDTTRPFVGAEGTLGIVTEVTVRLVPITVATARFPDVRKASEAVIEILNTGIGIRALSLFLISDPYSTSRPECIELVDAAFIRVTMATKNPARERDARRARRGRGRGEADSEKHGSDNFWPAQSEEEAAAMWTDRKNAHYSGLAYAGDGATAWSTDVCVPISNLPRIVYETQKDIERSGIMCFVLGYAGDGSFHTFLAFKTDEDLKTVWGLVHRMVKRALALDGTCTGEHCVGVGKKESLVEELGTGTVALMKTIKRAIVPLGIMNLGKLYPDDDATPDS